MYTYALFSTFEFLGPVDGAGGVIGLSLSSTGRGVGFGCSLGLGLATFPPMCSI
jgi:hypothetical protein